jgi:hypothetical protein
MARRISRERLRFKFEQRQQRTRIFGLQLQSFQASVYSDTKLWISGRELRPSATVFSGVSIFGREIVSRIPIFGREIVGGRYSTHDMRQ